MRAPSFFTLAILLLSATRSHAQTPPKKIKTSLCSISSVFQKLQAVKVAPECRAGCAGGKCPPDWFPRNKDKCSAGCGKVFEPFWDECGDMLLASKMGGMDEMKRFYDHCLQSLYPPGAQRARLHLPSRYEMSHVGPAACVCAVCMQSQARVGYSATRTPTTATPRRCTRPV
eukprot:COSAG01_NODE_432_length_17115_cov_126.732593_14_plen_172_part_00